MAAMGQGQGLEGFYPSLPLLHREPPAAAIPAPVQALLGPLLLLHHRLQGSPAIPAHHQASCASHLRRSDPTQKCI
eukprot:SAG31_NODE_4057_length_3630_cov_3.786746_4_plen_76_part_00